MMGTRRFAVGSLLASMLLVASWTAGASGQTSAPDPAPPPATTLLAPTGVIAAPPPVYTWNAVAGTDSYLLWVGSGATTALSAWYTAAAAGCGSGLGTCSVAPALPLASGVWYFNVKGMNGAGTGPWTAAKSFTIGTVPAALTLVAPSGSIGALTPTYTWNAGVGVESYLLWVGTGTTTALSVWYTAAEAGCASGLGTCSVTPATTLAVGSWYFNLKGKNIVGTGPFTASKSFFIVALPTAATLVSPSGLIGTATPTYTWQAVPGADSYQLWVGAGPTTALSTWFAAADIGCAAGTGLCSATPATPLAPGPWYFNVKARSAGGTGPWTSALGFTYSAATLPGPLSLISPSGEIGTPVPTYTWNAAPGVDSYLLWVGSGATTAFSAWYTAAEAGCASGTGTCSATPASVLAPGRWLFNLRGRNVAGTGPWTTAKSFTYALPVALGPPTLVSPSGEIWNDRPAYTWNALSGADSYQLWVGSGPTTIESAWYSAAAAGCVSGAGTCAVAATTALGPGAWAFNVQGRNAAGDGQWGAERSFTVQTVGSCEGCHNGSVALAPNVMTYWTSSGLPGVVGQDGGHGDPGHYPPVPCTQCHDLSQPATPYSAQHGTGVYNSLWNNTTRSTNTAHLKADFFTKYAPGVGGVPGPAGDYSVQVAFDNYCMWECHNLSHVDRDGTVGGHRHHLAGETSMTLASFISEFNTSSSMPYPGDTIPGIAVDADLNTDAVASGPKVYAPCVSCHNPHGTGTPRPPNGNYPSNYMLRAAFPPSSPAFLCAMCHYP